MEKCKNYFIKLNIFQKSSGSHQEIDEDPYEQRTKVVATRVYFLLLVLILIIFLLVTCLNPQTITNTIQNPTLDQIKSLPADRICPCSRISFSYDKFVSSNVSFHQVCSSDFVSNRWISSLFYGINASYLLHIDFRSVGFAQFQALASFCRLSQASVNQTLSLFGSSLFISSNFDPSSTNLHTKVMTTFNRFNSSMATTFKSRIQLISTIIMGNQFLNALETNIIPYYDNDPNSVFFRRKEVRYFLVPYRHTSDIFKCFCTQSEVFTDENCHQPSGIFEEHFDIDINTLHNKWYVPTVSIPGFISSCMPVDASLLSSLECFFNQSCVNSIFPYQRIINGVPWNFTALNSNNILKPSRFNINSSIKSIVDKLMVEEWFIQEEELYEKYFNQCAPVVCTYLTNVYSDFLTVLNTFVGLLGGVCSVLDLIVLPVVRFIRKRLYPPPVNSESSQSPPISFIVRWYRKILSMLKRTLKELNLFKISSNDDNNQSQIRYQRIATRLYIGLLGLILVILTFCLALIPQTYIKTIEKSTQANFLHYHSLYPSSLKCACTSISIPYKVFLTIEPHYHQMCSSDIISSTWLSLLYDILYLPSHIDDRYDYSQRAGSQFILLKKLCTEAEQTIINSLEQFLNQTFITSQAVSQEAFEKEANELIEEWKIFTKNNFLRTLNLIQDIQYGNHLVARSSNSYFDLNMIPNTFVLNSLIYYDQCNCMLSPSCRAPMRVYRLLSTYPDKFFPMSDFFVGCFPLKALLQSTLECFYNQTCIDIVTDLTQSGLSLRANFTSLNATRNLPKERIDSVVSKLFVDNWSSNISFDNYFTACAPQSCTYEYIGRQNLIFLVTSIISIYGGLSTGLQIIFLVVLWLIMKVMNGNISLRAIKTWLYIRITQKQHWTKGIHIILVVTSLITLYFASTFTLQTTTKKILNTSLENYEQLLDRHYDNFQCPCTQISIPYKSFMNVTVSSRHQICSSPFITDEWISTLPLPIPRKEHSPIDFNKTAISFFQFLASLCQLSEQHLTDEISDLMRRSFINTNAISRRQFDEQIQSIIDQFEQNIRFSFLTTFQLIRAMISDNHLMTVFETNWQWMDPNLNHRDYRAFKFYTKPIVYNGSCNCALSSHCVQESSTMAGLMVGCYPLESLLKSTFECLYNVSCFSLLQYVSRSFAPLNDSNPSRYQKNSTVESILNHLMVEQWNKNVTYEKYYDKCAPSLCSYSYIEHNPALQVLTLLFGLYGGLTIIMKIVALLLVALWQNILIRYQRRHVRVHPICN